MAEWIKFDGSEEHKNLISENNCKLRLKGGGEANHAYIDAIDSFLICEPHPHREMIIEWANTGRPVYVKTLGGWVVDDRPEWFPTLEYSFDHPKEKIRYRVALMKEGTMTADSEVKEIRIENNEHFVKWLTDWQEVEIDG